MLTNSLKALCEKLRQFNRCPVLYELVWLALTSLVPFFTEKIYFSLGITAVGSITGVLLTALFFRLRR